MTFHEYPDRDMLMLRLADHLAGELRQALSIHDRITFAVAGGTTPGPVYEILSDVDLDWERVDVMLTDERWVPETSDRSNTSLLRTTLLRGKAAQANLVPLFSGDATPEDGLAGLSARVEAAMPISVLLLGMGTDMHTASLFPGADNLNAALAPNAPGLMAMRAPGAPELRITLTAPVLQSADQIHILIVGDEKRRAVETARAALSTQAAPVRVVLDSAEIHWAP